MLIDLIFQVEHVLPTGKDVCPYVRKAIGLNRLNQQISNLWMVICSQIPLIYKNCRVE
jgi:hypothetical protein